MKELWTLADIATYSKFCDRTVRSLVSRPDFPRRIGVTRSPRWDAEEVRNWFLAQKEAA